METKVNTDLIDENFKDEVDQELEDHLNKLDEEGDRLHDQLKGN
jgi:hypothetical protein